MDMESRTGLPCSVALLDGHAQVDMPVFTRECLNTRADASAVTLYFMLHTQLDTPVHVLANCTWLRPPTES